MAAREARFLLSMAVIRRAVSAIVMYVGARRLVPGLFLLGVPRPRNRAGGTKRSDRLKRHQLVQALLFLVLLGRRALVVGGALRLRLLLISGSLRTAGGGSCR